MKAESQSHCVNINLRVEFIGDSTQEMEGTSE
jgi:hypothetical protein